MSNLRTTGTIEAITKDGKGFLLQGTGKWYRCFTPAMLKAQRGDEVSFSYTEKVGSNGVTYNNVAGIVTGASGASNPPSGNTGTVSSSGVSRDPLMLPVMLTRERAIIRQSSLAQAVNYCAGANEVTPNEVIEIARIFEAYASGDMDIEMAKSALKNEDLDGADA
jgi:hypothetical protein